MGKKEDVKNLCRGALPLLNKLFHDERVDATNLQTSLVLILEAEMPTVQPVLLHGIIAKMLPILETRILLDRIANEVFYELRGLLEKRKAGIK